ncbi:type II CRISPR RNA-guided endonuclease Cas9 [Parvicella tangerina]|uniref:CRISPR-associated endonuclease Cas9 n=1 Tax=Parvicella tangerina TaxID=2829795 RepID=A0A916NH15_9FLAO|nr:type II CRISPR RNA-guided endonuclease Cas9 [Parvicella tangerina]CAG5080621.1 CRISPR-associated endonuclease Cas9 [Parvicella tangerina]
MKRILGLDLGTNSIGWSLIQNDFEKKEGQIDGLGVRIIPMSQDVLGKFDAGQSHSQTADRTKYRGVRRLYQRDNLRRERLHRVLNILGFLPKHYADNIDFEKRFGQFKPGREVKLNYRRNEQGEYEFVFKNSFEEMVTEFKKTQPHLFYTKENGQETNIPYDWTLYYLRKKALSQPLTKEELAWVILNFNQKRGYYQLRGEEVEEDKNKQFVQLRVKELIDSGDKVKGNTLYDVYFENGWKYDKQIVKVEDWKGRTKEFIVTISTLKNGDTKYSYKTVDSEKDWIAIKAKTEQDIDQSKKTVGQFIYETLLENPTQKIRGKLVKTIERKFYRDEFKQILSKQIELQPELFTRELYKACVEELYPRNEAHQNSIKDKGFEYLFTDDIIFYQRPLKSQKSNIAGCQLEFRSYKKKNVETGKLEVVKEPVKAISKSHPLFQEFRIWQWLQNLRIYNKEKIENGKLEDITHQLLPDEASRVALFDFLNSKKELDQKQFLDFFVKQKLIDKKEKENYRWNYVEDKKYPFAETRSQFLTRMSKVNEIENVEEFLSEKTQVGTNENSPFISRIEQLWHIIYSVSDIEEYKKALGKFAEKHNIDKDSFVENFIKFPPFKSDYGSYSKKAIEKLLPVMRIGKYWSEEEVPDEVKKRANSIMERVKALGLKEVYSDKDLASALANVSDDDISKQLIKSLIPFKDINPVKGLNTYQATYLVYGRHSEVGDIQRWESPADIDTYLRNFKQHSLRNPIVEQVVTETLRVVRDIWSYYGNGERDFFNEIHVELGREMKSPKGKREEISKRNTENENTNYRIQEVLKDLMGDKSIEGDVRSYSPSQQEILKIFEEGVSQNPDADYSEVSEDEIQKIKRNNNPTQKEIQRYRLWLEQGYISPYTGKLIPLSKLFTHEYQIEHIIPQSRYFDNSLSNKVICESEVNEDKGNKTAYEYLKEKKGSIVNGHQLLSLDGYEAHVGKYFKKNKQKLKKLLSEDIPEGFINRQLNDSRYISKLIKGLLSNIVREENEQEATSKNLIPVTGVVTSKLKHDWGLNDKWNEIIAPRFKRLNELTQSNKFGFWDKEINAFRIQVPDEISKGFSKKRIDHRHHALDALVVACTTRNHTHYLSALNAEKENYGLREKLLIKNEKGHFTKTFQMPWSGFTMEAKNELEKIIVSFKQNLRVINKTNNKFWSYKDENGNLNIGKDGKPKKKLRKQTKGDSWAIRQPLHEETISGVVNLTWVETKGGEQITATRKVLDKTFNLNKIEKITDTGIQKILKKYLTQEKFKAIDKAGNVSYNSEIAFSPEGVDDLNKNMKDFNGGKNHKPIYKVRVYEKGSGRFPLSHKGVNKKKYAQGSPNLYFTIYRNGENKYYETVPLHDVIAHQKEMAHLSKNERIDVPVKSTIINKGKEIEVDLALVLSPLDLVYIPTLEERANGNSIDFNNLTDDQIKRIYNVNDFSGYTCYFSPNTLAKAIYPKEVDMKYNEKKKKTTGSYDTKTASLEGDSIKDCCIKLRVDRLGNISRHSM